MLQEIKLEKWKRNQERYVQEGIYFQIATMTSARHIVFKCIVLLLQPAFVKALVALAFGLASLIN